MSRGIALLVLTLAVASLDAEQIRLRFVPASVGGGGGDEHAYFEALAARGDCYKAWSLRPQEGVTVADRNATDCDDRHMEGQLNGSAGTPAGYRVSNALWDGETKYRITQSVCPTCGESQQYLEDTDPDAQEAALVSMPAFHTYGSTTLAADIDADDTTITISGTINNAPLGRGIRLSGSDEIMVISSTSPATGPLPVTRGAFGTTPTAHTAGEVVQATTNTLDTRDQLSFPIRTDPTENATYVLTWDYRFQSGWLRAAAGDQFSDAFKHFNLGHDDDYRWDEQQIRFDECGATSPSGIKHPDCTIGTHVASFGIRLYSVSMSPFTQKYPMAPVSNTFLLEQGKWIRTVRLIHQQREDTGTPSVVTTLSEPMDASQTTMTVHHPIGADPGSLQIALGASGSGGEYHSVFCGGFVLKGASWPGRAVHLSGGEIVTIDDSSCPTGDPRTFTVVRGAYGTTPTTHADESDVALVHDPLTIWACDEDSPCVKVYDRIPAYIPQADASASIRGRIKDFLVEFDTSSNNASQMRADADWAPLKSYLRNLAVLKNPSDCSPTDCTALLEQPLATARTAPSVLWRDVQLLIVLGLLAVWAIRALVWARGQARRRVARRAVWERVSHA